MDHGQGVPPEAGAMHLTLCYQELTASEEKEQTKQIQEQNICGHCASTLQQNASPGSVWMCSFVLPLPTEARSDTADGALCVYGGGCCQPTVKSSEDGKGRAPAPMLAIASQSSPRPSALEEERTGPLQCIDNLASFSSGSAQLASLR
ncbi:hypothetical protein EDB83DRAFT_2319062 [Lactarius deliciosus]|nr:hypothetical protein EDB83DRAFT_2319062 [Lactarius deliciosus]